MTASPPTISDIVLYSAFAFLGNFGVALTGFGMAIIYLFAWQIAVLAGFESNFKYAVFLQALALFAAQPLLVYKTKLWKYASRKMLLYFIPVTILSTPIGQYVSSLISTDIVEMVGGILVCFVAAFELYQKRILFWKWLVGIVRWVTCSKKDQEEYSSPSPSKEDDTNLNDNKEDTSTNDESNNEETMNPDPEQPEDDSNTNSNSNSNADDGLASNEPFHFSTVVWTIVAGFASGFLGGLCGIRGPPIILYMLHPPHPVCFSNKKTQRATGAAITLTNVAMRVIYYLVNTLAFDQSSFFVVSDWPLYLSTVILSLCGVLAGTTLFNVVKDKKDAIKGVLTILLVLCGISLVLSSFAVIEK